MKYDEACDGMCLNDSKHPKTIAFHIRSHWVKYESEAVTSILLPPWTETNQLAGGSLPGINPDEVAYVWWPNPKAS